MDRQVFIFRSLRSVEIFASTRGVVMCEGVRPLWSEGHQIVTLLLGHWARHTSEKLLQVHQINSWPYTLTASVSSVYVYMSCRRAWGDMHKINIPMYLYSGMDNWQMKLCFLKVIEQRSRNIFICAACTNQRYNCQQFSRPESWSCANKWNLYALIALVDLTLMVMVRGTLTNQYKYV